MANESTNQLNLAVVALVALVAIVGLVALVMNAADTQVSTGSTLASAEDVPVYDSEGNLVGDLRRRRETIVDP